MCDLTLVEQSSPALPTIDPSDPRLHTPPPDYAAIHFNDSGQPYLTDRFLNLAPAVQRYVLALAAVGAQGLEIAERVAKCCRAGSVSCKCSRGKYARAHKHHCGDHFCPWDSTGRYKFNKWAAKRDHTVFHAPHEGIEIKLRKLKPKDDHIATAHRLRNKAARLIPALTTDSVSVLALAERIGDMGIRVVFPGKGTHSFKQLKEILVTLGLDAKIYVTVKRGTPEELFHWAFNGFYDCAAMSAGDKAGMRIRLINQHTIRTTGRLYEVCHQQPQECESRLCPVCKDHDLDEVPVTERAAQPVDEIQDQYEHVDWSAEHLSPFRDIRKESLTDKSRGGYAATAPEPSPPS
jgi:hypothetical protein